MKTQPIIRSKSIAVYHNGVYCLFLYYCHELVYKRSSKGKIGIQCDTFEQLGLEYASHLKTTIYAQENKVNYLGNILNNKERTYEIQKFN